MKHLKIVGLFAMAAAALMAFAGSASAQTLTAPTGTEYTGAYSMSQEGSSLTKAGFAEITCTQGTISGNITTNTNTEVSGSITAVSLTSCKEGQTVDTLNSNGTLTILKSNHSVTATGIEITESVSGVSCVYGFGATGTAVGTATNTTVSGADRVTLALIAKMPKISGGFLCASPAAWTANYVFTTPAGSFLD